MNGKIEQLQKEASPETIEVLRKHYGNDRVAGGIAASIAKAAVDNYKKHKPEEELDTYIAKQVALIFDSNAFFARQLNSLGLNRKEVTDIYKRAITVHINKLTSKEAYPGTPRNAPCPCGSGKKYKKCCGK